jgi:hypothetical protein
MDYLDAIDLRCSRRSYSNLPISQGKVDKLNKIIGELNIESGLDIEYMVDGSDAFGGIKKSYGMFKNVRALIVLKGNISDINLKEKVGYFGEKIILEATKIGLGTCWVGGTFDKNNKLFDISKDKNMVCVITIGNVEEQKTIKEKAIYSIIHRKAIPLGKLYTTDTENLPSWFIDGIKASVKTPTAINSMKFRFEYVSGIVTINIPDNTAFDMVDLGIAKLHFEIGSGKKFKLGNNAELLD